ncbi:hypothetical protein GGX14DRAFT_663295, partial [Mycena pura]
SARKSVASAHELFSVRLSRTYPTLPPRLITLSRTIMTIVSGSGVAMPDQAPAAGKLFVQVVHMPPDMTPPPNPTTRRRLMHEKMVLSVQAEVEALKMRAEGSALLVVHSLVPFFYGFLEIVGDRIARCKIYGLFQGPTGSDQRFSRRVCMGSKNILIWLSRQYNATTKPNILKVYNGAEPSSTPIASLFLQPPPSPFAQPTTVVFPHTRLSSTMRSIARILPVLVFAGRVALASPIVVSRDSLVICTDTPMAGGTGNISQNDLTAYRAGGKTDIPGRALSECSANTPPNSSGLLDSSGQGDSLRAGGQSDGQPTPPPAPSNNNVQLDESTQGLSPPSTPSQEPSATDGEVDSSGSPLRSSDNSPNADIKADDNMKPSETNASPLRSSSNSPNADDNAKPSATDEEVDSSKSPLRPSSNSPNADIKADDNTKPSETNGSPLRSSSNSPNADDNTKPSATDGEVDSSKSPLRSSSNSPNADIKADDNTKPSETNASPLRSSSNSSNADDNTKPSATDGEVDSSGSPLRLFSSDEDTEGEANLLDKVSNLAAGANRAQVKGKAVNKAPAAGDSDMVSLSHSHRKISSTVSTTSGVARFVCTHRLRATSKDSGHRRDSLTGPASDRIYVWLTFSSLALSPKLSRGVTRGTTDTNACLGVNAGLQVPTPGRPNRAESATSIFGATPYFLGRSAAVRTWDD